jgi:hypothetical protein
MLFCFILLLVCILFYSTYFVNLFYFILCYFIFYFIFLLYCHFIFDYFVIFYFILFYFIFVLFYYSVIYFSWHSDDEVEWGQDPVIASVSFGSSRRFLLKEKTKQTNSKSQPKNMICVRIWRFACNGWSYSKILDAFRSY